MLVIERLTVLGILSHSESYVQYVIHRIVCEVTAAVGLHVVLAGCSWLTLCFIVTSIPSIAMTTQTGIRHGSSVHLVIRQSKTAQSPASSSQPSAAGTSTSTSTSVRAGRGVDCVSVTIVL